jgi:hypothetical protein
LREVIPARIALPWGRLHGIRVKKFFYFLIFSGLSETPFLNLLDSKAILFFGPGGRSKAGQCQCPDLNLP